MPDLPELYEALDNHLRGLLDLVGVKSENYDEGHIITAAISALCAAIEVKQTQEFHEYLNRDSEIEEDYDRSSLWDWDGRQWRPIEEETTTTEGE